MMRSIFDDPRTMEHIFEKYHLLFIQHLSPKEVLNLTGYSSIINQLFRNCNTCMNKIFVRIDGIDAEDPESLKYVIRSKRKYRNFRFMCYSHKNFSKYCIEMIGVFADNMNTLEVFDMVVGKNTQPEHLQVLSKLQNLKLSAFKGNFQHIFMLPGMRYQTLTFESMLAPVDLKSIGEYNTATKCLTLKNSKFINLETFTFYDGYCKDFVFEVNKRNNWEDIFEILRKYADLNELLVAKKNSPGIRLILSRGDFPKKTEVDVEMEPEKTVEDKLVLFTRRRLHLNDKEVKPSATSENLKATLEIDELTLPLIVRLAEALPLMAMIKIYQIHPSIISEMFRYFHKLEKVVTASDNFENEFTSKMFEEKTSLDPVANIPENTWLLVFHHLDLNELLDCTTVTKKWNGVLGQLDTFIDKVTFKLDPHVFREEDVNICKKSQRNYRSIEMSCKKSSAHSLSALEIIHVFSSCVVDLTLNEVHLEKISSLKDRFIFNQLVRLTLNNPNENTCVALSQNCESLKAISISSISLSERIVERLKGIKTLKGLTLIDCTFDHFKPYRTEHLRKGEKPDKLDLKLNFFGLLFDRVNCWKVQETDGFKKFIKCFEFTTVHTALLSGVRGVHMSEIVRSMRKVKKLKVKHFWENELNSASFYKIRDSFELELLTFGMGQNYKWKEIFPQANQITLMHPRVTEITEDDLCDKKVMKLPASTMLYKKLFVPKTIPNGCYDPILKIPEKIHDLVFQHLSGHDILNAFEVSRSWNNFCKVSESCAKKIILYLKLANNAENLAIIEKSTRQFANLITDYYQPSMIKCFSNLRRLAITFHVPGQFTVPDAFPHLESLIIHKCPGKFYNHENILLCLKVFSECTTLKYLEIYEATTVENYKLFWDLLANNHKLKVLKVHQCSEFFYFFCEDFSHRIHFQLDHLDYRIPQKFSLVGSNFEQNLARFIKKQKAVKIVDFNLCSALMLNAAFHLPNVHTIRVLRITGYDLVMLQKNDNLKEFVFPNTPQIYVTNEGHFEFRPIFEAFPKIERLYVFCLTSEMLMYAAKNLKDIKYLTCDRFNGFDVEKAYRKIKHTNDKEIINKTMEVYTSKFNLIDTDERTFDRLFGEKRCR